jgi:hypothetical protein
MSTVAVGVVVAGLVEVVVAGFVVVDDVDVVVPVLQAARNMLKMTIKPINRINVFFILLLFIFLDLSEMYLLFRCIQALLSVEVSILIIPIILRRCP